MSENNTAGQGNTLRAGWKQHMDSNDSKGTRREVSLPIFLFFWRERPSGDARK